MQSISSRHLVPNLSEERQATGQGGKCFQAHDMEKNIEGLVGGTPGAEGEGLWDWVWAEEEEEEGLGRFRNGNN